VLQSLELVQQLICVIATGRAHLFDQALPLRTQLPLFHL
jgi:hypothetical protein